MGVIKEAGVEAGAPKAQGALLYTVASKVRCLLSLERQTAGPEGGGGEQGKPACGC